MFNKKINYSLLIPFFVLGCWGNCFAFSGNENGDTQLPRENYYELGVTHGKSSAATVVALMNFEKDLTEAYKNLGEIFARIKNENSLKIADQTKLRHSAVDASIAIFKAEKKLLISLGVPEGRIRQSLLGNYFDSSTNFTLSISTEFLSFIHGASDSSGQYISAAPDFRNLGSGFSFAFPGFCFSENVKNENTKLPNEIIHFAKGSYFPSDVFRKLFNVEDIDILEVTVSKSRGYSIYGVRSSCGNYAEIDRRVLGGKMIIFKDEIKNIGYLRKHPEMEAAAFNEIKIHESLHLLTKNSCEVMKGNEIEIENVVYSRRRISEALASIGTIAVITKSDEKYNRNALINSFFYSSKKFYGLTFDLFFRDLLMEKSRENFEEIKKKSPYGDSIALEDFPAYMRITESSSSNDLGSAIINERKMFVSAPLAFANFNEYIELLMSLDDQKILAAAERALVKLEAVQKLYCT